MQSPRDELRFYCPGEDHPISKAVHLARLATGYSSCRDCVHRFEIGQAPLAIVRERAHAHREVSKKSLFTATGVRGIYLNEISSAKAGEIAGAWASLLWEAQPLVLRPPEESADHVTRQSGPQIVIAYDERPSSPEIVTGVAKSLRRMGCSVIDIGPATRPCFWFAVGHLNATAGIHVTGAGRDPAWTGMDFVESGAVPVDASHRLADIEERYSKGYLRPTRQSSGQRTFHARPVYEAGLGQHFHALRPLRICLASANRPVNEILGRLFQKLACHWLPVDIPVRSRDLLDPGDLDNQRMRSAIQSQQADFGLLIDDDGQTCSVFDELGNWIAPRTVTLLFADTLLQENRQAAIVIEESCMAALLRPIDRRQGLCAAATATLWGISHAMRDTNASFAGGDSGRYWFREEQPTCDAILTLAKLLQTLSRSDAEMSMVIRRLS